MEAGRFTLLHFNNLSFSGFITIFSFSIELISPTNLLFDSLICEWWDRHDCQQCYSCDLKVVNNTERHVAFKFNEGVAGKVVEECKLRVVYLSASGQGFTEDKALKNFSRSPETNSALQRLKDERDVALRQTQQLQRELEMMKRRRFRKSDPGFSLTFAFVMGLIGIMAGFILNLSLSSPAPVTEL